MSDLPTAPSLLAVGDPLVALVPTDPVTLEEATGLLPYVGGAELNTAIGVRRLGVAASWLGRVGDDPLGRRVLRALADEHVDTSLVVVDPDAPTGLYLREWLPDGVRRPYYYRHASAGTRLTEADWPTTWSAGPPTVLHVTGITAALSASAIHAVRSMVARATALGCRISVDPNYRHRLWPDRAEARRCLDELASRSDVLLLSEEDADLLFDSTDPVRVREGARELGVDITVLKRGAAGAIAWRGDEQVVVGGAEVSAPVDPVGAGDGFDAGFLAATMCGLALADAARCGAWCGARAVERVGENAGYPTLAELPPDLRDKLAATGKAEQDPWTTSR
ncbi:MAG TPA: sugar kinase [Pseudonocardiaceae bacterium]|jgi:2-dehydro-3-deoxygluconokinase|nr:sugar kinase [Pseudonocardiaceae bacterium]